MARYLLVVEDDPALAASLVTFLAGAGYPTEHAPTALAALERLRDDPLPSVILLDLLLPGIDGFELLRRLRADDRLATIPVCVISALVPGVLNTLAPAVECTLPMPFDPDRVLAVVECWWRIRRQ